MKKVGYVVLVFLLCLSSFIIGRQTGNSDTQEAVGLSSSYPLLAKRIFIDDPNDVFVNFADLRQQIQKYVSDNSLEGSIYFEYLPTGTSIRVDGDEQLVAASLIKLPAAMSLYRLAEKDEINLDETIQIKEEWLDSAYGELYKKGAGYSLTLREATRIMLEDSDNTALKAIGSYLPNDAITGPENPFNSLDVDITQNVDLTVSISARSYSSILKCLYFSCYLSKDDSSELLGYLTKAKNKNRLPAGVLNKDILIAHKIGNFAQDTQSDCGVVYIPKRNYLLCVMIKSPDNPSGDKKIADISRIAFDFVSTLP